MNTQDHVPSLNYGTTSKQPVKSTPTFASKDISRYKTPLSFFSSLFFPQSIYFSFFPLLSKCYSCSTWHLTVPAAQIFPELSARITLLLVGIHVQVREVHSPFPVQPQPLPLEFPAMAEKATRQQNKPGSCFLHFT